MNYELPDTPTLHEPPELTEQDEREKLLELADDMAAYAKSLMKIKRDNEASVVSNFALRLYKAARGVQS